ncbi:MAG: peptide deformylase [Saprospiraceae bacterium]
MIKPIYLYGHPVLQTQAKDIQPEHPGLNQIISDMFDTMYHAKGVGLAAPQIGLSIRLFIIDTNVYYDDEALRAAKGRKKVFINPLIIEESGPDWGFEEGCLSIPGINAEVSRTTHVHLRYMDEQFNIFEETFDEITARVIQHEYDHIEGKLFIQHINPMRRQMLNGKLNKIRKGIVDAKYPVRAFEGKR